MTTEPSAAAEELERAAALRRRANDQRGKAAALVDRYEAAARPSEKVEPAVS